MQVWTVRGAAVGAMAECSRRGSVVQGVADEAYNQVFQESPAPLVKLFGSNAEGTISTGSSHMSCGGVRDPQGEGKPQELYWGIQLASGHILPPCDPFDHIDPRFALPGSRLVKGPWPPLAKDLDHAAIPAPPREPQSAPRGTDHGLPREQTPPPPSTTPPPSPRGRIPDVDSLVVSRALDEIPRSS